MQEFKETRKTRYTRNVLRESLIELMMKKPITKITITELCKKADINRTTFYAHYKDQYELLKKIEEEILLYMETLVKKYENKRSKKDILQMVEELANYFAENKNSIQVILSDNGDINFQKKIFYYFLNADNVLDYFASAGSKNHEIEEYSYAFVVNGALGLFQHWLKKNMSIPASEIAKILINRSSCL